MALVMSTQQHPQPSSRSSPVKLRRKSSWATLLHPRAALKTARTQPELLCHDPEPSPAGGVEPWRDLDKFVQLGLNLDVEENNDPSKRAADLSQLSRQVDDCTPEHTPASTMVKPFHKWMKTLQRRAEHKSKHRSRSGGLEPIPDSSGHGFARSDHRRSSSDSSFRYVAGVRSASISVAGSAFTHTRRNTIKSSHYARTDRSGRASMSQHRRSEDSIRSERSAVDPAVTERLLQRRRILEELISTEESYIGDLKFLMNVYVTILASLPTQHPGLRSSINRNLTDIVELHEEILGDLHRAVPNSEYKQIEPPHMTPKSASKTPRHQRWHSLDSVPEDEGGASWLQTVLGMTAEPDIAAEVARIFGARMHRFFVYEEYGAKYEMMIKDVASASRTMPQWETYQKGLEALAASLGSVNNQVDRSRKSLTTGDLLVKPIQRICKYPLLFAELLKYTPVYDCPNSHAEIENVLARLREATSEINRATDDPSVKISIEVTWLLQDRLVFSNQSFDAARKRTIRALGQIQLCGALHVCWQTRAGVDGQYMVCLLYKECLCLATASKFDQLYTIQACIGLNTIKIEDADNGRGLQCHTAPFSWKLVFEIDHQLYEIIMTACTPREEQEWKSRLERCVPNEAQDSGEPLFCSSLSLNIKSLGTVFGKPGSVARRLSIHRATTVGPKSPLCQVILKNTTTLKEPAGMTSDLTINRSQSLLTTTTRIPILAPPRGDRARLEAQLADVWSRNVLPFPGITTRSRSEHLVRSSASTMMRKLSVASITNSFAKRSGSSTSISAMRANNEEHSHLEDYVDYLATLDCDVPSSPVSIGLDQDDIQRLPVIRDMTERTSSCSSSLPSGDTLKLPEASHNPDISKPNFETTELECLRLREKASSVSISRPGSANSAPQQVLARVESLPPAVQAEKKEENITRTRQPRRLVQETQSPGKASKRSKVGSSINRGFMTGAIRSLFR